MPLHQDCHTWWLPFECKIAGVTCNLRLETTRNATGYKSGRIALGITSQGANYISVKTDPLARGAGQVFTQLPVLVYFAGRRQLKSIRAVVEWARKVDDRDTSNLFQYNIGPEVLARLLCVRQTDFVDRNPGETLLRDVANNFPHDPIMAFKNLIHDRFTVVWFMGEGAFSVPTYAALQVRLRVFIKSGPIRD